MNVSPPARASAAALAAGSIAGLIALAWPVTAAAGPEAPAAMLAAEHTAVAGAAGVCAPQASAPGWPAPTQGDLLLAGAALMVGIALRRASF